MPELGHVAGGNLQVFPDDAECIKQRVDEVLNWVDSVIKKSSPLML